ncbi:MAG: nitroreductase [Cyanobacteria bacterium P01_A01_bin.40]
MMSQLKYQPRDIKEDDFPLEGRIEDQLKFLLNYAILAPSSHNTQPWSFKIVNDTIELYIDETRALPIADPNYRELIISCGAALFNLRIAIRHFGYGDMVNILPDLDNSDLLARIQLGSKRIVKLEENFLFRAISKRRTNRQDFDDCQLPDSLVLELKSATRSEGSWLQIMTEVIPEANRKAVIDLIVEGDLLQMSNLQFRRELAQWIHTDNNPTHDGIPPHAPGMNHNLDAIAPLISGTIRSFDLGESLSAIDCQLASQAPVLMLISSESDKLQAWLETGEALAHLLLRARIDDVWASFFNQPIQVPHLRSRLQSLFPAYGYPQIMLRLGYPKDIGGTPRRSVEEVLN